MKRSIFFISLIALSIFSFVSLNAQKLLYSPELRIHTKDGSGYYRFEMTSTSSIVWEAHASDDDSVYITTATKYVDPGDITISGDSQGDDGWNSDKHPDESSQYGPLLGRGYYNIHVAYTNDNLIVNCYGVEFENDITVTYDCDDQEFLVGGEVVTSIDLYTNATKWLQPTKPRNFECTNPCSTGKNPNFEWDKPTQPNASGISFIYKIYRREGSDPYSCVAEDITSTSWADDEVTIETSGSWFNYYATAHITGSPESVKSAIIPIKGQNSAKPIAEQLDNFTQQKTDHTQNNLKINSFPNPFNPSTNISYYLPTDGDVQLIIYNIRGQKIAELSNGYKFSG